MKLAKRILAFAAMLCLLMLCVMPAPAMAAANYKGKTQTFVVRLPKSEGYADSGVRVTMRSTSADGKTGTITFNSAYYFWSIGKSGHCIQKGTTYKYTISSMKDGGKITLTVDSSTGILPTYSNAYRLTGKIHINSSKGCKIANIWKIDSFKLNYSLFTNAGFYFRNN